MDWYRGVLDGAGQVGTPVLGYVLRAWQGFARALVVQRETEKDNAKTRRSLQWLVDLPRFALHVIHEQVLPQGIGRGEVGFAATHLRDFLNEVHQAVVAGQHERVD